MGGGKALRNDQRVLTPDGWKPIGEMRVGDLVVTPSNEIERVTGVFPQGVVNLYKIVFEDDREVIACGDHLWKCRIEDGSYQILTTKVLSVLLNKGGFELSIPLVLEITKCSSILKGIDQDRPDLWKMVHWSRGAIVKCEGNHVELDLNKHRLGIKSIGPVEPDHATCISVSGDEKLFITENFIVTHNTWGILADNLQFIHDPNYFSVFFRSTTTELETNLWPEAVRMYRPFLEYSSGPLKGKWRDGARIKDKDKVIIFPGGARSKFAYMQYKFIVLGKSR